MAVKTYLVRFGTDNPSTYTGITPTFSKFLNSAGNATTAPSISELSTTGLFTFQYDVGTAGFIGFILDGTASLNASVRYVAGALEANDQVSFTGTSLVALGASLGSLSNSMAIMGGSINAMGISLSAMGVSLAVIGTVNSNVIASGASLSVLSSSLLLVGTINSNVIASGITLNAIGASLGSLSNSMAIMGGSIIAIGVSVSAVGVTLNAIGASLGSLSNSMAIMGGSLNAMGASLTALGNSALLLGTINSNVISVGATLVVLSSSMLVVGNVNSSFGDSSTDPTTLFGFLKRLQELQEGDSNFAKGTGVWTMYNRGSTTTIRSKTIADSSTSVTKI